MSIITGIESAAASAAAFVKKELQVGEADLAVVFGKLDSAASIADAAVNDLKTWGETPGGKTIEAVIEAVPGIGPYVGDVLNFLPQLIIGLGWAKAEFTKSPADIVSEGIQTAISAVDPNIKATNLITLQSHLNVKLAALQNVKLPIQAAAALSPAIHSNTSPETTNAAPVSNPDSSQNEDNITS